MSMGMLALTFILAIFGVATVMVFRIIVEMWIYKREKREDKMLSTLKDDEKEEKIVKNQKNRTILLVIAVISLIGELGFLHLDLHIDMGGMGELLGMLLAVLCFISIASLIAMVVFYPFSEEEIKLNIKKGDERIKALRAKSTKDDKAPAPIVRKG